MKVSEREREKESERERERERKKERERVHNYCDFPIWFCSVTAAR